MERNTKVKKMKARQNKPTCFVISPIGLELSNERKRVDEILHFALLPVLGSRYNVIRADHIAELGSITVDVMTHVVNADLAVADLTGFNPNVMYEIGVRHAFNKATIQIFEGEKLPFDLADQRTIMFSMKAVTEFESLKGNLYKTVTALEDAAFNFSSPVHRAVTISAAAESKETTEQRYGQLLLAIKSLEDTVDGIDLSDTFCAPDRSDDFPYIGRNRIERLFDDLEWFLSKQRRNR